MSASVPIDHHWLGLPQLIVRPEIPDIMQVDLLSAGTRDSIIAARLREWLAPFGMIELAPRRWIDGSTAPVRRLFELPLLKGASLMAAWGFSLDFVPHISAGRVRWHRSDKTAKLDVFISPRRIHHASFLFGPERLQADLDLMLPSAVEQSKIDWDRGSTYEGMLGIIHEIKEDETNYWGYEMLTQMPLAFAFLSAKVGDMDGAEPELEKYIKRHDLDEDEAAKLRDSLRTRS